MADVDEDVIPTSGPSVGEDIDLSDETQDFRFLAALSTDGSKIPKRGEKDFEPHATELQSSTLEASRQAMHNALSIERSHHPRGYTIATYHPESNMAYAQNPKGVWVPKMGQVLPPAKDPISNDKTRGQRLWLLPEEALYLIERGTVDIRWPATADEEVGVPMSLQAAYAMFLGDEQSHDGALTFERYSVYTALRRGGYTVLRAPSWQDPGPAADAACYPPVQSRSLSVGLMDLLRRNHFFAAEKPTHAESDMVGDGFFRSYAAIYKRLGLIDAYDPTLERTGDGGLPSIAPFRVAYHVYKPNNSTFKKSAPGPPDFRLAVINARETGVPTLEQLNKLMATLPYEPPADSPHVYAKLKHGYKNVVLAVVAQGVTSYLRFSDAAFVREKLYDRPARGQGGKRGGKQGGRGRGR